MRRIFIIVLTIVTLLSAAITVNAENKLPDKLNKIITEENPLNNKKNTQIVNSANSVLSKFKKNVVKITGKLESNIGNNAQLLTAKEGKEVNNDIKKALPKVIDNINKEIKEHPNNTKLLLKLAVAYEFGGKYSLAITVAEKVLALDPNNKEAALVVAQSYKLKGEINKGIVFLQGFIKNRANDPMLRGYLATMRFESGDREKAKEEIEAAILSNPRDCELYQSAGKIYSKIGEKGIKLFIDGKKVDFRKYNSKEPMIKNKSTFIPLRALTDNIGAEIKYDKANSKLTIKTKSKEIVMVTNKKEAVVNSKKVKIDEPIQNFNGNIFVPLKFIAKELDKEVGWYPYSKYGIISINKNM